MWRTGQVAERLLSTGLETAADISKDCGERGEFGGLDGEGRHAATVEAAGPNLTATLEGAEWRALLAATQARATAQNDTVTEPLVQRMPLPTGVQYIERLRPRRRS